jgi:hypothetical protein
MAPGIGGVDTVALRRESPEEQGLLLIIEAPALRD